MASKSTAIQQIDQLIPLCIDLPSMMATTERTSVTEKIDDIISFIKELPTAPVQDTQLNHAETTDIDDIKGKLNALIGRVARLQSLTGKLNEALLEYKHENQRLMNIKNQQTRMESMQFKQSDMKEVRQSYKFVVGGLLNVLDITNDVEITELQDIKNMIHFVEIMYQNKK